MTSLPGTADSPLIAFDNSYARLSGSMHVGVRPTSVEAPRLIKVNVALAAELGIDASRLSAEIASGNVIPEGAAAVEDWSILGDRFVLHVLDDVRSTFKVF